MLMKYRDQQWFCRKCKAELNFDDDEVNKKEDQTRELMRYTQEHGATDERHEAGPS